MHNDRDARILELLLKVVDLPEAERRAYLSEACKEAPELQSEVESILADDANSEKLIQSLHEGLGTPHRNIDQMPEDLRVLLQGSRNSAEVKKPFPREELEGIHNYKLLEPIGEGGMGIVYLAEQIKPVKRRVALKIIKLGMDTKQVVARFEAERQALAVMAHPNIARVYDAGATETGRPYFVMELVQGISITEYCDQQKLTTQSRLELFIPVCQAVQHAHQKGVIHRDLKPSNVLVKFGDEGPVPKIIDFGIAKATEHRLTERTLFTEQGQLVGTPEYMSPEQAEMSGLDVDTRTDIYSLGVMLYELLVGMLPFDPKILRKAGYHEIQRIIREADPPKASTRLSGLGDTRISIAKHRRTNPAALHKQLVGDLDWITMKAMSKDRTDRYSSASELVADIMRHMNHEPIQASSPGTSYRVRKFARKHRTGVIAATLVVLTLLIGIGGTSIGLIRAKRAEVTAREEAETTREVSDFLVGLFEVSDPGEARGNSITAREILDRGAERIRQTMEDQPEVRSRLMRTMGEVYWALGLFGEAEHLLEEAVEVQRRVEGEEHSETLASMSSLAKLYLFQGRYDESEPLYNETLEIQRRVLGKDHPEALNSMYYMADVYANQGRHSKAESLCIETLEARRRVLGRAHPNTISSMEYLAILFIEQGRFDEAEQLLLETLRSNRRLLGKDHPHAINSMNNLANLYADQGRLDEARLLYIKTLKASRVVLGEDHPKTLNTMGNLATLYTDLHRYDEAELLQLETLEIKLRVLGADHPSTLMSWYNLACVAAIRGQREKALGYLRDALENGLARDWIFDDSDLDSLRGDPEFEAIIAEIKKRLSNV